MFETMKRSVLHVAGFFARLQSTLLCALYIAGNSLLEFKFLKSVIILINYVLSD